MPSKFCQEITSKEIWERFFDDVKEKTFLQSWNWGEFQERMGNKIWRLGVYDNGNLIGISLAVKLKAKRGTFLLIQHLCDIENQALNIKSQALATLVDKLKEIGRKEGASFIRVAPLFQRNEENIKLFKDNGFREAPMHANAYEATWRLDLSRSEDELMENMRKTTRYLIRQAQKNADITIEKSGKLGDLGVYQKLHKEVARRQRFVPVSKQYLEKEFEVFQRGNEALLFSGKCRGEPVAGALVIFWSGIGFYHQAASDSKYAKLSIPYLLQWEAIKEAKKRGCKLYDFWGYVDPKENPKHPWAGPTLFKMGFGGKLFEYIKTQDLPISLKYWLTYFFEKIRKAKRGL